jgi:Lrp/AsnC family transcriptional regulator for asnA, asnC and gidA
MTSFDRSTPKPAAPQELTLLDAAQLSGNDRAIIEVLQNDGRTSYAELARTVGITEKTARRRVADLRNSGRIDIVPVTDPRSLGYGAAALLGVTSDGSRPLSELARACAGLTAVDYVVTSAGRYSVFVEIFAADLEDLRRVADDQIRTMGGVGAVEMFPYLSVYYQQAQFSVARLKHPGSTGVRPRPLTEIDRRILAALSADGRARYLDIARSLGVSEGQVRQRVQAMTDSGALKVMAIVNPMGLEYRTMAWLAVRASPGTRMVDLADRLADLPFVTYVAICTGRFDLFAEVICLSEFELLRLLDDRIRQLDGIGDLEVSLYLELHYKPLRPLPFEPANGRPAAG